MKIEPYISNFRKHFPNLSDALPWHATRELPAELVRMIGTLPDTYRVSGTVAIHKSAIIEEGVILKGPLVIGEGVFIGAHAYLRGGVYLAPGVSVGPGCEIKTSLIFERSALAHFNFVGDSIIGRNVNMEAGSIIANHHNDREDKTILVLNKGHLIGTDVVKFGALVGDGTKIGANAVLSPGTILERNSIVARLALVRQDG